MKKHALMFLTAALCLTVFSCAKTEAPEDSIQNGASGQQVEPSVPEVVPEGYVRVCLNADTESSKTTIANGEGNARIVSWTAGDAIKVLYDGGTTQTQAKTSGTSSEMVFDVPETVSTVYLAYPKAATSSLSGSTLSVTIPAEQDGAFATSNYSVASAAVTDASIQFYNASALIKIVLTDATLTKAVIKGANGEALVGTVPFTFGTSGVTPGTPSNTATELTVNFNGAGTYYAATLPGLSLPNGLSVRFFRGEQPAGGWQSASALSIARSKIASLGELDKAACNRYVTVSGAGNKSGYSWENAWGRDQLKAFIVNSAAYTADDLDLMDGITFRMAAGTYVLPDNASDQPQIDFSEVTEKVLTFQFVGGYPAAGGDTASPSTNVTTLSGGEYAGVLWALKPIHLSFDGFTVTKGRTAAGGRGAITFASTGSLSINNCIFTDNVNTATCGALDITEGCQFVVSNTTFSGNSAAHAGAFNVDSYGEGGTTTGVISNCRFLNNTVNATSGTAAAMKVSNGVVTIDDCSFTGNTTLISGETGTHGGAVWLDGGQATFNRCTFTGNSSRWGGAIYSKNNGNGTFNNCVFGGSSESDGNFIQNGSGGAVAVDNGNLTFTDCTFQGNVSTDRGGVFFVSTATGSVTVNGGTYTGNKAAHGAVFYAQSTATVNISNAEFSSNTAGSAGGVLLLNANAKATLAGNNFHDNFAAAGGVVSIYGSGTKSINAPTLTINGGNVFRNNSCTSGGGAIRIRQEPNVATSDSETGNETKAKVTISGDNQFIGNYANGGYGGCLDLRTSGTVSISGATFTSNETKADQSYCKGGALNLQDSGLGTGDFTLSDCKFIQNHTYGGTATANNGGAVNVGGNNTNWAMKVKMNNCFFDRNYAKQGGAIMFQDASAVTYLNNCVFTGNYISYRYGTTIQIGGGTVCMNNCSFADDTYSTESATSASQQCAWLNVKPAKLVMSNCTLIGTTHRSGGVDNPSGSACLLRFDGIANTHYLINNIIATTKSGCVSIWSDNSPTINLVSNKLTSHTVSGSNVVWNTSGVNSEGFSGNSSCFGSLAWTGGTAWNNSYWAWNGTLSGGSNTDKASLADVKSAIQSADSGFYTWLNGLGALDKDGRGNARASSTWPGAYQN